MSSEVSFRITQPRAIPIDSKPSSTWNGRSYQRIEHTGYSCLTTALFVVLTLATAGLFLFVLEACEEHNFRKALASGDMEKASNVLRRTWFKSGVFVNRKYVEKLKNDGQTEKLKYLDAQIDWRDMDRLPETIGDYFYSAKLKSMNKVFDTIPEIKKERSTEKFLKSTHRGAISPYLSIIKPGQSLNNRTQTRTI